jgi:hypothetical protein
MNIKSILETHNSYSLELELALLRHFERLRNDILETIYVAPPSTDVRIFNAGQGGTRFTVVDGEPPE